MCHLIAPVECVLAVGQDLLNERHTHFFITSAGAFTRMRRRWAEVRHIQQVTIKALDEGENQSPNYRSLCILMRSLLASDHHCLPLGHLGVQLLVQIA